MSYGEYEPRALLRLEKDGTDRRTDGSQTVIRFPLDAASVKTRHNWHRLHPYNSLTARAQEPCYISQVYIYLTAVVQSIVYRQV